MSGRLVLITGGSGHLGYRAIVEALLAGYSVRAAVRSQAKADAIAAAPSIKQLSPGEKLAFVVVPDIVAPDAYNEAVKGTSAIIHIASPMFAGYDPEKWEEKLIQPSVNGTLNMLNAAFRESSVKRVVITSSIYGAVPFGAFFASGTKVWSPAEPTALPTARPFQNELEAYAASKVYALHAIHDWLAQHKPQFDVVNMVMAFIMGRNELVQNTTEFMAGGTNQIIMRMPLGIDSPFPITSTTVHLHDAAWIHVRAADESIPAGSYAITSNWRKGTDFDNTAAIIAREFPEAVAKGILKNSGKTPTVRMMLDASETEKVFGIKFKSYDEQVKSVVAHWLELNEKEQKEAAE